MGIKVDQTMTSAMVAASVRTSVLRMFTRWVKRIPRQFVRANAGTAGPA